MSFAQPGDLNEYQGTVLKLIEGRIVNLSVDYHVTKLFGSKDIQCTMNVRDKLESITFPENSMLDTIQQYAFYRCSKLSKIDLSPCKELRFIESYAFAECSIKYVTFPTEKFTTIGESGFEYSGLVEVYFPPKFSSLGFAAFRGCSNMVKFEFDPESECTYLSKYMISNSKVETFCIQKRVSAIYQGAFESAFNLLSITVAAENKNFVVFSKGVMDIKKERFVCIPLGLTGEYIVPNGTTVIGQTAFIACKFTKITFPETLKVIENWAFFSSKKLTSITIPDSVTRIDEYAFHYCRGLQTVKLSKNCKVIAKNAFLECLFSSIVIPEGVETLGDGCFNGNPNLKEIILPSTIKEIGGKVFPENDNIKIEFEESSPLKITKTYIIMDKNETFISQYMGSDSNFSPEIPNTIKTINTGAFSYKQNLVGITFPQDSQLTEIKDHAFHMCKNLKNVVFPQSLVSIGIEAFSYCIGLTNLEFGPNFTNLAENCFAECTGIINVNLEGTSVTNIAMSSFRNCSNLVSVSLPSKEISFYENCFSNCNSLSSISFPQEATVKIVSDYSFFNTSIQSFSFPDASSITHIKRYAFANCRKLTSVKFCDSIEIIGYRAFAFTGLTSVDISIAINTLEDFCFTDCKELTTLNIKEGSVLNKDGINLGIFSNCIKFSTIKCPEQSNNLKVYIGALFDPLLKHLLVFPPASPIKCLPIPETVETIGNGAFMNCANLYSIIISKGSVRTIGNSAFEGCKSLHYINIPDDVTTIGEKSFEGCSSLFCGVDVESTNPEFVESLFTVGKLSRSSLRKCNELTCKYSSMRSTEKVFANIILLFLSLN